jgi:hypothetical protein
MIKQQFGLEKTRPRGLAKNRRISSVLAALTNLFLARRPLLATAWPGLVCPKGAIERSKTEL